MVEKKDSMYEEEEKRRRSRKEFEGWRRTWRSKG